MLSLCTLQCRNEEKSIEEKLRSMGLRIQRERICESLHRVDPGGMKSLLHHRQYHVECPNAVWHIDVYQKLIRWSIVIHGGVDGYSRLVTYLKVSNNNCATITFSAFEAGIS